MTSGRSYINWMKEAGRGHLVAILSWGGCLMLLGGVLLGLQFDLTGTFFGMGNNKPFFLLDIGMGIGIGFLEFGYLLQERKQEFYFSLPVKKSTVFYSRYLHGLFHGLLPMVCYMFICGIYQSSMDALFMEYSVRYTFRSMLVYGMVFMIFYHITVFAVCICGRIMAVFCMLGLILCGLHLFLEQVCLVFMEHFYETFYRSPVLETLEKILVPWQLGRSLTCQDMYEKFQLLEVKAEPAQLGAGFVWVILFGALAVFAHKYRKVENVGCVFTIKAAEQITEAVLTVLAGTGVCGLLLLVTGIGDMARAPAVLILSVTGILSAFVIHFVYVRYVRAVIKRSLWIAAECAVIVAVVCALSGSADVYDTYLPENDEVESVGIALAGLDMDMEAYNDMKNIRNDYQTNYLLEKYELSGEGKGAGMEWISRLCADTEAMDGGSDHTKVTVCFRKPDGREVYRTYPVSESMFLAFSDVYETEEYKQAAYPLIMQDKEMAEGARFVWDDGVSEQTLKLTEEEKAEFSALYRSDIETLRMCDLQTAFPEGSLSIESEVYDRNTTVMIYPFYEKCTSFLKMHGVNLEKQVTDYPVQSVIVRKPRTTVIGQSGVTIQRYETEEGILEWKDRLIPREFCIQPLLFPAELTDIEAEVVEPESGAVISVECYER